MQLGVSRLCGSREKGEGRECGGGGGYGVARALSLLPRSRLALRARAIPLIH